MDLQLFDELKRMNKRQVTTELNKTSHHSIS